MEQKPVSDICELEITIADVNRYNWESVLSTAEPRVCVRYPEKLFERAAQLGESGDEKGQNVFRFLGSVASMALRADETDCPFNPLIMMESRRSAGVEDFSSGQFDTMEALMMETRDAAMRARLGDVIWVARKNSKAAKLASEAYLENFKLLKLPDQWAWGIDFLRRGFSIARSLGSKNEPFPSYSDFVAALVRTNAPIRTDALAVELVEILLDQNVNGTLGLAELLEQAARNVEAKGNYLLAQRYYEGALRIYNVSKNEEAVRNALLQKGECLIRQAETVITKPGQGYLVGAQFLAKGVECLRRARAPQTMIAAYHKQLRKWQIASATERQASTHEMDISGLVESARKHISGKSLRDAVMTFALDHALAKPKELRQRIVESIEQFPLSLMLSSSLMSNDGRLLVHKPPVIGPRHGIDETGMSAEMFSQARTIDWPLRVNAFIEPGRLQILNEHRPSQRDLVFLVEQNPFVPPGHEDLFLRGLHAGFHGDLIVCAHLIIPQIEEAIRHVLQRSGIVTSKLSSKLVQEERLLGVLLSLPETTHIFGEEMVFELRGVLCEKFGFDLRNRLAHGFLTTSGCFAPEVLLAWWLVLRLCCFPIYCELEQANLDATLIP